MLLPLLINLWMFGSRPSGWEEQISFKGHPYIQGPKRVRFKFKDEEEKHPKVAKIIHDVAKRQVEEGPSKRLDRDLEIALRIRLNQEEILFKALYLIWLQYEQEGYRKEQFVLEDEEVAITLLLM